jgi:hypothetical protein
VINSRRRIASPKFRVSIVTAQIGMARPVGQ